MCSGDAVLGFGEPLLFFAVSPQKKQHGEDCSERDREPGTVRHLGQRRREICTVQAGHGEPREEDNVRADPPYEHCSQRNHAGVEKCHKHNAYAVRITQGRRLEDMR